MIKKFVVLLIILFISISLFFFLKSKKEGENLISNKNEVYNSNVLENIKYIAKDADGNKYTIKAEKGEIDLKNSEIIYLEKVKSLIKPQDSDEINITSKFGKYNTSNYNTIFSKNVIITYLDYKITGEYLDFSITDNRMIISKNIVFTNLENILKADVIELNIKTKDTKIFMYEENKKVNIKNKNYTYGNN